MVMISQLVASAMTGSPLISSSTDSSGGVAVGQGMTRLWPDWMGAFRSNSLAAAMLSAETR